MVILDTSFLVAYFRDNDVHHRESLSLAKKHAGEKMVITFLVLQELINIMNRKGSTTLALEKAKLLTSADSSIELFKLDESYLDDVLMLYEQIAPHGFSYTDVSLIHLSKELELPVLTFDKNLEAALAA